MSLPVNSSMPPSSFIESTKIAIREGITEDAFPTIPIANSNVRLFLRGERPPTRNMIRQLFVNMALKLPPYHWSPPRDARAYPCQPPENPHQIIGGPSGFSSVLYCLSDLITLKGLCNPYSHSDSHGIRTDWGEEEFKFFRDMIFTPIIGIFIGSPIFNLARIYHSFRECLNLSRTQNSLKTLISKDLPKNLSLVTATRAAHLLTSSATRELLQIHTKRMATYIIGAICGLMILAAIFAFITAIVLSVFYTWPVVTASISLAIVTCKISAISLFATSLITLVSTAIYMAITKKKLYQHLQKSMLCLMLAEYTLLHPKAGGATLLDPDFKPYLDEAIKQHPSYSNQQLPYLLKKHFHDPYVDERGHRKVQIIPE